MWWLVIRIMIQLLPAIIRLVREQRIRSAAQAEIIDALTSRLNDAEAAGKGPFPDEVLDPNNRDNLPR